MAAHDRAPRSHAVRHLRLLRRRSPTEPEPPSLGPDCLVMEPLPGAAASLLPPVRIFLGTQPAQRRAERVFIWSVARNRNPGRRYEIYRMNELVGFDRRGWTTGFTNYRFAIPHFAGERGRAIYNDVDQVYLSDPGELFDLPMGEHGYLAVAGVNLIYSLLFEWRC